MRSKIITVSVALLLGACTSLQKPTATVNVPDNLKPPGNEALAMIVPAKGVQIYECRAKKDQPGAYEWAFVAPEADLFDTSGKKIGRHYAGPHWESTDGSKIAGTVKERADAPQAPLDRSFLETRGAPGAGQRKCRAIRNRFSNRSSLLDKRTGRLRFKCLGGYCQLGGFA